MREDTPKGFHQQNPATLMYPLRGKTELALSPPGCAARPWVASNARGYPEGVSSTESGDFDGSPSGKTRTRAFPPRVRCATLGGEQCERIPRRGFINRIRRL